MKTILKLLAAGIFGPSYGPDVSAYASLLNTNGVTNKPSGSDLGYYDRSIVGLRSLMTVDSYHIYGKGELNAGKYNIRDNPTFTHTFPAGDPTYQQITGLVGGVKSNGSSTYINTKYPVNLYSGIETQMIVILYISESSTAFSSAKTAVGARKESASNVNAARIDPLTTAAVGSRQGYAAADTFANTDMKGLYILGYDGANVVLYKDGVKDSQAVTPSAPNIANEIFLLARNGSASGGSTPGNYLDAFVSILGICRGTLNDTLAANIKSNIDALRAGIGLLVTWGSSEILWNNASITFNMA